MSDIPYSSDAQMLRVANPKPIVYLAFVHHLPIVYYAYLLDCQGLSAPRKCVFHLFSVKVILLGNMMFACFFHLQCTLFQGSKSQICLSVMISQASTSS